MGFESVAKAGLLHLRTVVTFRKVPPKHSYSRARLWSDAATSQVLPRGTVSSALPSESLLKLQASEESAALPEPNHCTASVVHINTHYEHKHRATSAAASSLA